MTTTTKLASDRFARNEASVWGGTPEVVRKPVVGWLVYDGDEDREVKVVRLPAVDESGFHLALLTHHYKGSSNTPLGLTRTGKLRRGGWVSVETHSGLTGWFKSVDRSFYERRK